MATRPFAERGELNLRYAAFGHFYSVRLSSGEIVECRSVLELVERSRIPKDCQDLSKRSPKAVFIMMNPGSSKPLATAQDQLQEPIHVNELRTMAVSLVSAEPDPTQYQVMRLMQVQNWPHVRVLNLSDLCNSKSEEFFALFSRLEGDEGFTSHSVFSEVRALELAGKIPQKRTTHLVLAWGLNPKLDPLIRRCLARIDDKRRKMGLLESGKGDKYRHPLPPSESDQRIWLERMIGQFEQ